MTRTIRKYPLALATVVGTLLQLSMVTVGHAVPAVALLFAPLGVAISLVAGFLYGRWSSPGGGSSLLGGAIVGGTCAFLGIAMSLLLGDVEPAVLAFGTASSALFGAGGGWLGRRTAASHTSAWRMT